MNIVQESASRAGGTFEALFHTEWSVTVLWQALHKRNASCRLEEDDDTTVFFPAPGTLPSGALALVFFHAAFKACSFHAPLKLSGSVARKLRFTFCCWLAHCELKWGVQKGEIRTIYNPISFFVFFISTLSLLSSPMWLGHISFTVSVH